MPFEKRRTVELFATDITRQPCAFPVPFDGSLRGDDLLRTTVGDVRLGTLQLYLQKQKYSNKAPVKMYIKIAGFHFFSPLCFSFLNGFLSTYTGLVVTSADV